MTTRDLSFSIIIPTRNEADDILATLEYAACQSWPAQEIIVVDDSDDETPRLVMDAMPNFPNLRLLTGARAGRCGARNQGIMASQADIVVILNADVHLPSDFLERLRPHYLAGAGYVLVDSIPANLAAPRARFVVAQGLSKYQDNESMEWTEGFSCRRDLIIKAGLFPVTSVPLVAGEDGALGVKLGKIGKKVIDRNLQVRFVVPVERHVFWRTYKERAYPHAQYYLYHRSLRLIMLRNLGKLIWRGLRIALVLPVLIYCWHLCQFSRYGHKDVLNFIGAYLFQTLAFTIGDWEGLVKLKRSIELARDDKQ
jgi:glycosyltransferase involved in cell wall biosynthesis